MKTVRHMLCPLTALALSVSVAAQAAEPELSVEERLIRLEQQTGTQPSALPANLELTGTLEVEGTVGEAYDGRSHSDLVVATVEFGVDTAILSIDQSPIFWPSIHRSKPGKNLHQPMLHMAS